MFRRPSLGLAEITWRWSVGFAIALLLTASLLAYLNSLPITLEDMLLFRSRQPFLISLAFQHIVSGSAPRLVEAAIFLGLAMTVAWIATGAMGRAVTVGAVLEDLREASASQSVAGHRPLRSLAGLNFLRVAAVLAALAGALGVWFLASLAGGDDKSSAGIAALIFLAAAPLVWLAWAMMNWLLSFASVYVVVRDKDAFGSIASAVQMPRASAGRVLVASTWFGLAHATAFVIATAMAGVVVALAGWLPPVVVFGGILLVTLFYFAVADFLYVGRLAAYVAIVEGPEKPPAEVKPVSAFSPPAGTTPPPESRVDPDELILSDVSLTGLS